MKLFSHPSHGLSGHMTLPGDKSISHRAALLGTLADGRSRIRNFLKAGVTQPMLESLRAMGVQFQLDDTTLTIEGCGLDGFEQPGDVLNCGSSATTMRLLAGAISAANIPAILDGAAGLRTRPMRRLVEPLCRMGVRIKSSENGTAPLTLERRTDGRPLKAIHYTLPVASAQVKTALLLAGLGADGPMELCEPGPSRDHTERMLSSMGVEIRSRHSGQDYFTTMLPDGKLKPLDMMIPGDISSAAFLIVASLIVPNSEIHLKDVGINPTRSGLLEVLIRMGADIEVINKDNQGGEPVADIISRTSELTGTQIKGETVVRMLDEFPALAVAAAYSHGESVVQDAMELRYKESDRITDLCGELRAIGVDARETFDGFVIGGNCQPTGGTVHAHGDHRLAMALAVAGLSANNPVEVTDANIITQSFPGFTAMLESLGANIEVEEA
jgi:3-phosphoshikimate 1-carboxyvinyltransferase